MLSSLLTLLLLGGPPVATVDLRGHAPVVVQKTLEGARAALDACLAPPPAPRPKGWHEGVPPVVPLPLPTVHLLVFEVNEPGFVVHAEVEGAARLDVACVKRVLLRLEFGLSTGTAKATQVKVPLACHARACVFPWNDAPGPRASETRENEARGY
ncbi:MAG: hypothetical protein Q8L48_27060 [Archangium sp.]|nr:hypothetical protein [Archangium sp.]